MRETLTMVAAFVVWGFLIRIAVDWLLVLGWL